MLSEFLSLPIIVAMILLLYVFSVIKIIPEYERGVVFRLGRLLPEAKGPGLILVFRPIDRLVRVSLRTVAMDVPPQDVITRDNVTVSVRPRCVRCSARPNWMNC
jgi:regulator of protease activity HflC (stomatin/prohibitin superfamily)